MWPTFLLQACSMSLDFNHGEVVGPYKPAAFSEITQNNGHYTVKGIKVINFNTNEKPVCDFLYVNNSNLPRILHRFRDTADYWYNFRC